MPADIDSAITKTIHHAPDWLRQDLTSKELSVRVRAEETLAAMVAAAIRDADGTSRL